MKNKSYFLFLENDFITIETAKRNLFYSEQFIDLLQYCWINKYPVSCSFSNDDRVFH
jgi:hypothetical protein